MDLILFWIFATIAVGCAVNLVAQRRPIASALSLVGVMGSLAVLYVLLGAEFIAAAQVIVYAGAVMVLFLFVIMLLNAGRERGTNKALMARWLGLPLLVVFLGMVSFFVRRMFPETASATFGGFTGGTPHAVGLKLFTEYLLPFEATSVLILIAILGALVLARKEID